MNNPLTHLYLRLRRSAGLFALIAFTVAVAGCSRSPTVARRPIPKGHAEIHIEFKSLSTDTFNKLTAFVPDMAGSHSAFVEGTSGERDVGEHNAYHGFWNSGFVDQTYRPDHPLPSPQVEAAMKASLESFLKTNNIDGQKVKFELRYEQ